MIFLKDILSRITYTVLGESVKKSKFEKKLLKADTETLCDMLLRKLNENPFSSNTPKNQMIYDTLPDTTKLGLLDMFYEQINGILCEARKSILTGLGQCDGRLVVYNGNVLFCCCEDLAELIANNLAFIDEVRIRIPGSIGEAKMFNGSSYSVDYEGSVFDRCPFCGAKVHRKVACERPDNQ